MKNIAFIVSLAFLMSFSVVTLAEDVVIEVEETSSVIQVISDDIGIEYENTTIEEEVLEIEAPKVSPGHWAYGFKRAFQNMRVAFTFDPVKKAKIRMNYLNEDLAGIQEQIQNTKKEEIQNRLIKIYQENSEKLETIVDEIKESANLSEDAENAIEWLSKNQLKHIIVLDELIEKLPEKAATRLEAVKERQIERIINKVERLEESGKIEKVLDRISDFGTKATERAIKIRTQIENRQEIIQDLTAEQKQQFGEMLKNVVDNTVHDRPQNVFPPRDMIDQKNTDLQLEIKTQQGEPGFQLQSPAKVRTQTSTER